MIQLRWDLAFKLPKKLFDNILILLKRRPKNFFRYLCGCVWILEYGSVWQQYASRSKDFIIGDVKISIHNHSASDVNKSTS